MLPKIVAVAVALGLLLAGFLYLPDIRARYQESRNGKPETSTDLATTESTKSMAADSDEVFDKEKLLAEWRTDRNLVDVGGDNDEGVADDPNAEKFKNIKILRVIPSSEAEVRTAHERSRAYACEIVPSGEPIELKDYRKYLTVGDSKGRTPAGTSLFTRRHVASIGFGLRDEDARQLPVVSKGEIIKFLESNFLSLQVRVEKDPVEQIEFLHPRPLATLAEFRGTRLTQPPRQALLDSLKNYRGLGMFVPPDEAPSLESLRTLVMVHRSERRVPGTTSSAQIEPHYEYIFIRATSEDGKNIKLHAFVTSENRTKLHYLRDRGVPSITRSCTIRTMLAFTRFSGLNPVESVTTGSEVDDRLEISMQRLDEYAQSQGWEGNAFQNLSATLDAIIRGDIRS